MNLIFLSNDSNYHSARNYHAANKGVRSAQFASKREANNKKWKQISYYPRQFIPQKLQILVIFGDLWNIIPQKFLALQYPAGIVLHKKAHYAYGCHTHFCNWCISLLYSAFYSDMYKSITLVFLQHVFS